MNNLEIFMRARKTNFMSGEMIDGKISWQLQKSPNALELRLFWFTEGKGTAIFPSNKRSTSKRPR